MNPAPTNVLHQAFGLGGPYHRLLMKLYHIFLPRYISKVIKEENTLYQMLTILLREDYAWPVAANQVSCLREIRNNLTHNIQKNSLTPNEQERLKMALDFLFRVHVFDFCKPEIKELKVVIGDF